MYNLNRQVKSLENIIDKIDERIETLRDKYTAIEENAWDNHREMTEAERNLRLTFIEEIEELETEIEEIQFAIDYLNPYTN